jgi:hypothetical protein
MISEQEQLGRPETVDGQKPILILTHTNAGVAALRGRLERAGVRPTAYRLLTIDGWGMRLVSMFPKRAGHDPSLLDLTHPGTDYPNLRVAAARLLKAGHINDVVSASFARLIVDEYQDCSVRQHALVGFASNALPTSVLGDPMQAIFGFGQDDLAKWDETVCKHFRWRENLGRPGDGSTRVRRPADQRLAGKRCPETRVHLAEERRQQAVLCDREQDARLSEERHEDHRRQPGECREFHQNGRRRPPARCFAYRSRSTPRRRPARRRSRW